MNSYFYHGIEFYPGAAGFAAQQVAKILEEGIITRNQARELNDDNYNHICLYKKNNEYDYNAPDAKANSARGGWIDSCFVFVINPQIEAEKATQEETNLVDEWRCYRNIPTSDIVGLALPFKAIEEYLKEDYEEEQDDRELLKTSLIKIEEMAQELNIKIYDSEKEDFTDELDATLSQQQK